MPIHDWKRVSAGIFHDFHMGWTVELRNALNGGLLPEGFYALAEPVAGDIEPDILTLEVTDASQGNGGSNRGGITLASTPPKVELTSEKEIERYSRKRRALVIRHVSGDRIVARLEIVSEGNKSSRKRFREFINKSIAVLERGIHLLLIDLQPPTRRDPKGIHAALWEEMFDEAYEPPRGKDRTLAAYAAGLRVRAFVAPIAVGDVLPEMPLFLDGETYVNVSLEATYLAAYRGVARRWKEVLEIGPRTAK